MEIKNKEEKVMGIIRHSLTFLGGILVMRGVVQESLVHELIGSLVSIIGISWSLIKK